jgi:Transposase IS116/IS110/IS902 family
MTTSTLEGIDKLRKDIRAAAELGRDEARVLVDAYYVTQENRIRAAHQVRTLTEGAEPAAVISWLFDQQELLEREIRKVLDDFSDRSTPGVWAKSILGIGPVIAAGLLCHIDIEQAPTVGHIWRYAGLDPTVEWKKGEKRPWNAALKRLCWLIGESFVKVSSRDSDIYGKVYVARKEQEAAKNEAGEFADQAAAALAAKNWRSDTQARTEYKAGRLPKARIHARAKRYATKLFLAHLHHVMYEDHYGTPPPKPYVIQHLGHAHFIQPPNWPL